MLHSKIEAIVLFAFLLYIATAVAVIAFTIEQNIAGRLPTWLTAIVVFAEFYVTILLAIWGFKS